uniref:Centromere protein O n=1 Tax=Pseudonaja textilis TaxID=8673 RepID=A0A670ZGH2_PSETE
ITAFEGTYLDSYYLDILIQQPLRIQHHSIPVFIPLEQIAHEHLQKDIKCFLSVLSDHLNAYARRKFQVDQLQERFAVFLEGCVKGNSLYNQLEFNYRVTEDGSFPFIAKIIYGNPMNALPTKVTVVCKGEQSAVRIILGIGWIKLLGFTLSWTLAWEILWKCLRRMLAQLLGKRLNQSAKVDTRALFLAVFHRV